MSLRMRIAGLLILGALFPALLLGVWALASSQAAIRSAEAASVAAIRHQTLERNLAVLEGSASHDASLIESAKSLSYTAAKYLRTTQFLQNAKSSGAPAAGSGWHLVTKDGLDVYIPKGIYISPEGVLELSRYQAIADFLISQPTAQTPFRLTVVSQTGLTWIYPAAQSPPVALGDPRLTQDYYRAALPEADPTALPKWTGVHVSPFTGENVVTQITPITRPGYFYGVVAVDVPLTALFSTSPGLSRASNVLVDTTDWQVVKALGPASPLTATGAHLGTIPELSDVRKTILSGKPGAVQVTLDGTAYLVAFTPIGTSSSLAVLSALPAADVNADTAAIASSIQGAAFGHVGNYALALGGLTLLLMILGLLASRGILRRLGTFAEKAQAFGQDMSIRLDDRRSDELSRLARGFNEMADRVQRLTGHLEEEVRDRTRLLERQALALAAVNDLGRRLMAMRDRDEIVRGVTAALAELGYKSPSVTDRPATGRTNTRVAVRGDRLYLAVEGEDELGILPAIAAEFGAALENRRLFSIEAERQNEARLQAILEERARLSREIHDTLAQSFLGIILHLRNLDPGQEKAAIRHHTTALELATRGLEEARRSVLNLRPDILEGRTLDQVLEDVLKRWGDLWEVQVRSHMAKIPLHPDRVFALMRILQEALENVRKHAGASEVDVQLVEEGDGVRLTIRDNGRGFPGGGPAQGHGLEFMAERVQTLGGTFSAKTDEGALLEILIPKREEIA